MTGDQDLEGGFSLVEVAIGLLVVGLLAGTVLKGYQLISQARLKNVVSQISSYRLALSTFREKKEAYPGDWSRATNVFGAQTRNGNGNGNVDGLGLNAMGEAVLFWQHLALENLISDPGKPSHRNAHFGAGVPSSPLGGGFTVETNPKGLSGLWLILGTAHGSSGKGPLLTPEQAAYIDKKLDNGKPLSGHVQSREGEGIASGRCIRRGEYNLREKNPVCTLFVHLS